VGPGAGSGFSNGESTSCTVRSGCGVREKESVGEGVRPMRERQRERAWAGEQERERARSRSGSGEGQGQGQEGRGPTPPAHPTFTIPDPSTQPARPVCSARVDLEPGRAELHLATFRSVTFRSVTFRFAPVLNLSRSTVTFTCQLHPALITSNDQPARSASSTSQLDQVARPASSISRLSAIYQRPVIRRLQRPRSRGS